MIVFSFSKKECEALALQMAPLELNDEAEQKLVEGIFWNAIDCLSEDDRRLPQVAPEYQICAAVISKCSIMYQLPWVL